MEAEIIRKHYGVAEGEVYPRWFQVGTIVKGQVAEAAVASGDAIPFAQTSREGSKPSSASQQAPVSQESKPKRRMGRPRKSSVSTTPGD